MRNIGRRLEDPAAVKRPRVPRRRLVLSLTGFVSLDLALLIAARIPAAPGYEISLYGQYPLVFWITILSSVSCGIAVLVDASLDRGTTAGWLTGLALALAGNAVFVSIPFIRGYAAYGRYDTLTHLGYIRDILVAGHVGQSNLYPVEHVLGAVFIQVTGIPLGSIPFLFFPLFSTVYVLNMYLLAKANRSTTGRSVFVVALALPLVYSFFYVNIHPSVLSLFMTPLPIYFYQKRLLSASRIVENTGMLIVLGFFITLFHPVTVLLLLAFLVSLTLARTIYPRIVKDESGPERIRELGRRTAGVTLILAVSFFTWYFSYAVVLRSFGAVLDWLLYGSGTPLFQAILTPLAEARLTPLQVAVLYSSKYGGVTIFLGLCFVTSLTVISKMLLRRRVPYVQFAYSIAFISALLIGLATLFGYFVEYEYNPLRVVRLALLVGTMLIGLVVFDFAWKRSHNHRNRALADSRNWRPAVTIVIFLVITAGLSMESVYSDPLNYDANAQVTHAEIDGSMWLGEHRMNAVLVAANAPDQVWRFDAFNFGVDTAPPRSDFGIRLPSHFGYQGEGGPSKAMNATYAYVVLFPLDSVVEYAYPPNVRPLIHQYGSSDIASLNADPTVNRVYSNGEFSVWILVASP